MNTARTDRPRTSKRNSPDDPVFKVAVDARIPIDPVFDLFKKSCNKVNFYISEVTQNSITAVLTPRPSSPIMRYLNPLLPVETKVTIVKLQVGTYESETLRLVVCKKLEGSPQKALEVIENFKKLFESWISKQVRNAKSPQSFRIRRIQLANYEEFTKLLSSPSTKLGKLFLRFSKEWKTQTSVEAAKHLPNLIQYIKNFIETVSSVLMHMHRVSNSSKVYYHYKSLAEKYVYSRLMSDLLKLYHSKHFSKHYSEKVKQINAMAKQDIMEIVGVSRKYQLEGILFPYESSVNCLKQMLSAGTPIEKLNCILEMISQIRTTVLEHSKGKLEIESMDDQLPVIIYVVSNVLDQSLWPQVEFLKDYTRKYYGLENETCALVHIESAILYIDSELTI